MKVYLVFLEWWKGWMQWKADGILDFTLTDHQKNALEELIISWIAHALSEISEKMIVSPHPKHDF